MRLRVGWIEAKAGSSISPSPSSIGQSFDLSATAVCHLRAGDNWVQLGAGAESMPRKTNWQESRPASLSANDHRAPSMSPFLRPPVYLSACPAGRIGWWQISLGRAIGGAQLAFVSPSLAKFLATHFAPGLNCLRSHEIVLVYSFGAFVLLFA